MDREIDLEEISDGKLYGANDLVKVGCNECEGCSECCRGMGNTIILDPLDVHRLKENLRCSLDDLLEERLELQVAEGIILPNLRLSGEDERCPFLNAEGRCDIHSFRPGLCRLFPLGRLYEDGAFRYFLMTYECRKQKRTKIKVQKWIDMPDFKRYEKFIADWHFFLKGLQERIGKTGNEALMKRASMYVLNAFYVNDFNAEDFYPQFDERLGRARREGY